MNDPTEIAYAVRLVCEVIESGSLKEDMRWLKEVNVSVRSFLVFTTAMG